MQIVDSASAAIAFEPTNLSFGNVEIGNTVTDTITVTNTGTATLQITQIDFTNNQGDGLSESNGCVTSLQPGVGCPISVTFSPSQTGAQSATLSVTDNASGSPQSVPLSGTGTTANQAPTVATGSASAVTSNSATLGGTVSSNGSDTHVSFQYATNSSMTGATSTPQQDIGSGTTAVPISANLYPLTANTTYYYQAMASNSAGTNSGAILSFTTLSSILPPTILSIAPNPVPIGSAETILISGNNFQTGGTLHFTWTVGGGGSDNRTDYDFVDSGDLIITINTGTVASTGWTVQMINPSGQSSNIFLFSVQ